MVKKSNALDIEQDGIFVYSNINKDVSMVTVEAAVENSGFSKTDCLVYAYITDRTGKNIVQAKEQRIPLKGNGTSNVKQVMAIAGATLWSLEDLICKGLFLL